MVPNEHFLFEEKLVHIAKVKRTFQTNVHMEDHLLLVANK